MASSKSKTPALDKCPRWEKLEAGHYQLSNGEYTVIKGKPDWSANDGRFPDTSWHLLDKDNKLLQSGRSGESLKWSIFVKYLSGKLGEPQPIVTREFTSRRHLENLTRTWDHEKTPEQLAKRQEWKDNIRDRAVKEMNDPVWAVWDMKRVFGKDKIKLVSAEHQVDPDGEEYIFTRFQVEVELAYWEYCTTLMKKRTGAFNKPDTRYKPIEPAS